MNTAEKLNEVLSNHGVTGSIVNTTIGPRVTRYDVALGPFQKIKRVVNLKNEVAMGVQAPYVRILPLPQEGVVGIEVPNPTPVPVLANEIGKSPEWYTSTAKLPLMIGADSAGKPVVVDLVDMPHLLIGGATGSGKSVGIVNMINGLIGAKSPSELRFIMIDPKMVELTVYNGLPHLACPVITNTHDTLAVLNELIEEMETRYAILESEGVQNISESAQLKFRVVVVIDELADLILSPMGKAIEEALIRLAQKSRAAGIHIIAATQRPVVRVVTGLIKANFPARMAFRVAAEVDSKVILDCAGAEELLGRGDMLFLAPGYPQPIRVQGALSTPELTKSMVTWAKGVWPAPKPVAPEPPKVYRVEPRVMAALILVGITITLGYFIAALIP